MRLPAAGPLVAAASFAIWAAFSTLPYFTGGGLREAWDTGAYWTIGIPLLLAALLAAGFFSAEKVWKLALWATGGHVAAVALVSAPGKGLGMLPLAVVFIGLPLFVAFIVAALLGRLAGRVRG